MIFLNRSSYCFFLILFLSLTLEAQTKPPNECIEIVDGKPEIKSEVFDMLSAIFVERTCQIDLKACEISESYLTYEPTDEEIQAALAEEALLNSDAILADVDDPVPAPNDEGKNSPVVEGLKKAYEFTTSTAARSTYNTTTHVTEKAVQGVTAFVAYKLSNTKFSNTKLSEVIGSRISRVKSRIRAKRSSLGLSKLGKTGIEIVTSIKSGTGLIAMIAGLTALEFLNSNPEASYIGNCSANKRSTSSQVGSAGHSLVPLEQFFSWDGKAIGGCFPSTSYHAGLYHFNRDSPDIQLEALSGGDPELCKNIHNVHARLTSKPSVQISSCKRGSMLRLNIADSKYRDILGSEITITGSFFQKPIYKKVHLMGQSTTGRSCRGDNLSPVSNQTAFWIDPNSGDACVSRSNDSCAQLWFFPEALLASRFGGLEGIKSKEDLEKKCLQRADNVTCSEGYDFENLTEKVIQYKACENETYVKHQTDLIRALHSTITKSAACCSAFGANATLGENGECFRGNRGEDGQQRSRSHQ